VVLPAEQYEPAGQSCSVEGDAQNNPAAHTWLLAEPLGQYVPLTVHAVGCTDPMGQTEPAGHRISVEVFGQ